MNILFYDIVPTNLVRFNKEVIYALEEMHEDVFFFFMFEHDDNQSNKHVLEAYPFAKNIVYSQFKNINWLKKYMKINNIDVLFINGQRIADDRVVLAAKAEGVASYMLQHGMYIPFLKRDLSFFLGKIKKACSYLSYSWDISSHQNSRLRIIVDYFRCYVLGRNQVEVGIDRKQLNVDHVFVYSEYWKQFHVNQFGYCKDQQTIVGTLDLKDMKQFLTANTQDNEVCYISQTLVEDGRLEKSAQQNFFLDLVKITKKLNLNLVVKMHPRGDYKIYSLGDDYSHVRFSKSEIPTSKLFVGHYSTLLAKPMLKEKCKVILFEFPEHPTPLYFEQCADVVIKNTSELEMELLSTECENKNDIRVFFETGDNFVQKITERIYCDYKKCD
jgi:hypothetical protein